MNEYPKNEELHQSEKLSIFWQIQIAISLDRKKINAFCLFYSIMHSLGLQYIIMDNVVSKNNFLRNVLMRAHCAKISQKISYTGRLTKASTVEVSRMEPKWRGPF